MKRGITFGHVLAAALTAALMTGPIVAQARDHDRDDRGRSRHDERKWRDSHERHAHDNRHDRDSHRAHERHWDNHRGDERRAYAAGYRQGRYDVGRYYRPAGYRYYAWHRGARLPAAYYAPRYVVHDYGHYHLYRPPHGHHWVRIDHDVVLAAVATGAVVAVVNNLFY